MTGGYLTLDFSDVEFKAGDSIGNFTLGYKKGIYNYIKKTRKPIYLILSPSIMDALFNYVDSTEGKGDIVNSGIYFLQPIFQFDSDLVTSRFFVLSKNYNNTISESFLNSPSLMLIFNPNDTISINEI